MTHSPNYLNLQSLDSWTGDCDLYPASGVLSTVYTASTWQQLQDSSLSIDGPRPAMPYLKIRQLSEDSVSSEAWSEYLENDAWPNESPSRSTIEAIPISISGENERRLRRKQQNRRAQCAYRSRKESHVSELRTLALDWQQKHKELFHTIVAKDEEMARMQKRIASLEFELLLLGQPQTSYVLSSTTDSVNSSPPCEFLQPDYDSLYSAPGVGQESTGTSGRREMYVASLERLSSFDQSIC